MLTVDTSCWCEVITTQHCSALSSRLWGFIGHQAPGTGGSPYSISHHGSADHSSTQRRIDCMLHCAICDQITVTDLGRVTKIVCEIFRYLDISRPLYYVLCRCQNCQYFEYFHADRNSYTLTISTIMQCIGKWMDTTLSHTTSTKSLYV